jgi:E3 ubiquitin-protein ligase RNF13
MSYQTQNPAGVRRLLEPDSGYLYVDVRTVEEFEQGHVPGAYNVPLLFRTPVGMEPNPEFLAVVQRRFAKDQKLVLG